MRQTLLPWFCSHAAQENLVKQPSVAARAEQCSSSKVNECPPPQELIILYENINMVFPFGALYEENLFFE